MGRWKRLLAVGVVIVGLSGCWPAPGAGPHRQSFNDIEQAISVDNVDTVAEAWRVVVGEDGGSGTIIRSPASHPIVSTNGTLLVASRSSIHAFDGTTGALRWQHLEHPGGLSNDAHILQLPGDLVAVGYHFSRWGKGTLIRDALTGADASLGVAAGGLVDSVRGSRVAFSGTFSLGCCGARRTLSIVDVDDPASSWSAWVNETPANMDTSRLTLGDDRVFHAGPGLLDAMPGTGTFGNGVRSFPAAAGVANCGPVDPIENAARYGCAQWIRPIDGTTGTSPVLSDDQATLYVGTDAGTLYAVETATGAVRWSSSVGSTIVQPPALAYGRLFVPTASGRLVAVDAADGSVEWSTAAGSELTVQPAVAGGVVFTGAADGTVAAYDTNGCDGGTCAPLWSEATGSRITGAPAVSLGKLFVGTEDGHVIAYGPGEGA